MKNGTILTPWWVNFESSTKRNGRKTITVVIVKNEKFISEISSELFFKNPDYRFIAGDVYKHVYGAASVEAEQNFYTLSFW